MSIVLIGLFCLIVSGAHLYVWCLCDAYVSNTILFYVFIMFILFGLVLSVLRVSSFCRIANYDCLGPTMIYQKYPALFNLILEILVSFFELGLPLNKNYKYKYPRTGIKNL